MKKLHEIGEVATDYIMHLIQPLKNCAGYIGAGYYYYNKDSDCVCGPYLYKTEALKAFLTKIGKPELV